ncbi:1495_t:CDS:2 [Acaulospora colombiana]|uniref:1495_t:CDS:1 n=1 Tax=Acaulospora colombiana TaxID=27376 RepID=A0ACA9KAZ9_9GLOM|nr:1495_t:CDS:2 [Acaulospora colombiana]
MSHNSKPDHMTEEVITVASSETVSKVNESVAVSSGAQENERNVGDGDLEKRTRNNGDVKVVEMHKTQVILVFVGLCFGMFLAALDQTIVATALPAIALEFQALDKIEWDNSSRGTGLVSTIDEFSNRGQQIGYLIISGIGIGSILQTTLLAGQQVVNYEDVASVTSLLAFTRTFGAAFGLAIIGSVFNNELSKNLDSIRNQLSQYHLPNLTSSNLNFVLSSNPFVRQHPDLMSLIINQFTKALDTSFKVAIAFGILVFLTSLLMGNEKPGVSKKGDENGASTVV